MLTFAWPWLLLLLPLPWIVWKFLSRIQIQQSSALPVPFFEQLIGYTQQQSFVQHLKRWHILLLCLIWFALVLAAARAQRVSELVELPMTGRDLLMAVDLSGSMQQEDMKLNGQTVERIDLVKFVVSDFVKKRIGDRLGLIVFGDQAYLQSPLSFDRKTLDSLLQEAQLGFAGERTAIGDAIGLAVKRLQERPESHRVLILLTDGANTAGEIQPLAAAKLAAQEHVKIYTIGIGADEAVIQTFFGRRKINPSADLDENMLKSIADVTGGKYFRAKDQKQLETIYQELDQLEPVKQDADNLQLTQNLSYWPLAVAFLLSLLFALQTLTAADIRLLFNKKSDAQKIIHSSAHHGDK